MSLLHLPAVPRTTDDDLQRHMVRLETKQPWAAGQDGAHSRVYIIPVIGH